jgi:hypothetical protein
MLQAYIARWHQKLAYQKKGGLPHNKRSAHKNEQQKLFELHNIILKEVRNKFYFFINNTVPLRTLYTTNRTVHLHGTISILFFISLRNNKMLAEQTEEVFLVQAYFNFTVDV